MCPPQHPAVIVTPPQAESPLYVHVFRGPVLTTAPTVPGDQGSGARRAGRGVRGLAISAAPVEPPLLQGP